MTCPNCLRDKPIKARNLCGACYQRWKKTGSTAPAKKRARSICNVGGCGDHVVSHGLCDKHRQRMIKHGHIKNTRPDCWGAKGKHPLFHSWSHLKRNASRHPVVDVWLNDFLQFVTDVGERPSSKHKLFSADDSIPIGPNNFVWKRAITERVNGEDNKTYMNRVQKVYRAVRQEAFQGYELKKRFGISEPEYAGMRDAQDGKCAICRKAETVFCNRSGRTRSLATDHCHTGGQVRGLLCQGCNVGLGAFGDDIDRMKAAITYLEFHRSQTG